MQATELPEGKRFCLCQTKRAWWLWQRSACLEAPEVLRRTFFRLRTAAIAYLAVCFAAVPPFCSGRMHACRCYYHPAPVH